jgi:hypothetical protein
VQKSAVHLSLIGAPAALGLWGDHRAACNAAWQLLRLHLPPACDSSLPALLRGTVLVSSRMALMVLAGPDCAPAV